MALADELARLSPDGTWPPPKMLAIYQDMQAWSDRYTGNGANGQRYEAEDRASGVLGLVEKYLTNRGRNGSGVPVTRLPAHLPIASIIATAMSDLLWSEPHQRVAPDDAASQKAAQRLDYMLRRARWDSRLPEHEELTSILSGVWYRGNWDAGFRDCAFPEMIHPTRGVPLIKRDELRGVIFWDKAVVQTGVYWHFELWTPGRIEHGLYFSTDTDKYGDPRPFNEHAMTAVFAEPDEFGNMPLDGENGVDTGYPGLAVVFSHNRRPAHKWIDNPFGAFLGRSDLDGIEDPIDMFIASWRSLMRDLRLGGAKVYASQAVLKTGRRGEGAVFDYDQEVFVPIKTLGGEDATLAQQMTAEQFAIRVDEHLALCRGALELILLEIGLGEQALGLTGITANTATEVASRDARSERTRKKKSRYRADALEDLYEALTAIDAAKFPQGGGSRLRVRVELPEAPLSASALAQTAQLLLAAQSASIETRVKMLHPDWSQDEVDIEVGKIRRDLGLDTLDLGDLPE